MTGTVESIPLITASILSKKLATGAHAVVFDVKTGNGAFMQKPEDAHVLGRALVDTTRATGRKASGYVTAMDRPVGVAVGNANEVDESIRLLRGDGPADLRENVLLLGADLLVAAGVDGVGEGRPEAAERRAPGRHARSRRSRVSSPAQGGNPAVCDDLSLLPQPVAKHEVKATAAGTIRRVATRELGLLSIEIGCGRARKDDVVDPASGFRVLRKTGDAVAAGEPLLVVELGIADDAAGRLPGPRRGLLRGRRGRGRRRAAPVRRREAVGRRRSGRRAARAAAARPGRSGEGRGPRPGPDGALPRPDLHFVDAPVGALRRSASGSSGRSAAAP